MDTCRSLSQEWVTLSDYYKLRSSDVVVESSAGRLILCNKSINLETGMTIYVPVEKEKMYHLRDRNE